MIIGMLRKRTSVYGIHLISRLLWYVLIGYVACTALLLQFRETIYNSADQNTILAVLMIVSHP